MADKERCRHCGFSADWHDESDGKCPDDDGPSPYSEAAYVAASLDCARELDSRTFEGGDVSLYWNGADVLLCLNDPSGRYVVTVPPANAGDAFRHPYFYLRES